jgi:uncharacterized protein YkwD
MWFSGMLPKKFMLEILRAVIQLISLTTGLVMAANGHIPAPIIKEKLIVIEVTPIPTPTFSPTPTPKKIIKVIKNEFPTPPPSEPLTQKVNGYRSNLKLTSLKNRNDICQAANKRLGEITSSFNHDGFLAAIASFGAKGWAENIWRGNPFSLDQIISDWDISPGHKQNLIDNWDFGCGAENGHEAVYIFIR